MSNKIQLTTVHTRISEANEFFIAPRFFLDHQKSVYENSKKIFKKSVWTSPDKLCKTTILHFTLEGYEEFQKDKLREKVNLDRELHALDNGIGITLLIQEYNLDQGIISSKVKIITEPKSPYGITDVSLRGISPASLRQTAAEDIFNEI